MYIFYIQHFKDSLKPIYSKDDLGHYWIHQAALYCGVLLILLDSCLMNS